LDQIHRELQRGKNSGEYLQIKGNSTHGFFTSNFSHMFPMDFGEKKQETPDFSFPPKVDKEPEFINFNETVARAYISKYITALKSSK
jgi:hypothetical protein